MMGSKCWRNVFIQHRINHLRYTVGLLEIGARGGFNVDVKHGTLAGWKYRESRFACQAQNTHENNGAYKHSCFRIIQGLVQQPGVGTGDEPFQSAHKNIASGIVVLRQHATTQKRHNGERYKQRSQYAEHYSQRKRANEIARGFRKENEGQEGQHECGRAAQHCQADLFGGQDGSIASGMAFAHPSFYIFYHHNRVVYEDSERYDEADNTKLV